MIEMSNPLESYKICGYSSFKSWSPDAVTTSLDHSEELEFFGRAAPAMAETVDSRHRAVLRTWTEASAYRGLFAQYPSSPMGEFLLQWNYDVDSDVR
jgi:hypothetical protein